MALLFTIEKKFGVNGEKYAFDITRTGNEGGFYAVLRAIAFQMAEEFSKNEIHAKVFEYYNEDLSREEKLAAPIEYLEKFGHLFPSELTEGNAGRIVAFFPQVLEKHPYMIRDLRRVGR